MQPITYSLIMNVLALGGSLALAIMLSTPWIFIIVILLQTHALERFRNENPDEPDEDDSQPMGFTADIKHN